VYNATGNVMWLAGNHNMKFGTEYRRTTSSTAAGSHTAVSPTISSATPGRAVRSTTRRRRPWARIWRRSSSVYPTGGSMSRAAISTASRARVVGLYAHNDWRARNKLTLNVGLRWEYEAPLTEQEPDDQRLRLQHAAFRSPIAAAAQVNYARNPIPQVPVSQFQVRGGLLYPDTGGPSGAWRRTSTTSCPAPGSPGR
jgi:outer membrane receptor protein involved in Fe transport